MESLSIFFDDEDEDGESQSSSVSSSKITWTKEEIQKMISVGSDRIGYVDVKSKIAVFETFKQVSVNGKLVDFAACTVCSIAYVWIRANGTKSLKRHSCQPSNVKRSVNKIDKYVRKLIPELSIHQLNKNITFGLLKDIRPLYSVEGIGFRHMAQAFINFGAKYGPQPVEECIQHRTTLKRTYVPKLRTEAQQEYKKMFQSAPLHHKFAFSKDMWSEKYNQRNFLSVIMHYIDDNWELLAITLGLDEVIERKTTEHIREKCSEMLSIYFDKSIVPDIFENSFSVTDGGSNMLNLFKEHLPCRCHQLNLLVDWTLNERPLPEKEDIRRRAAKCNPIDPKKLFNLQTHCPTIKKSLATVKDLVTYYKQSALNSKLSTTLKQEVCTRWDSELNMLESYVAVKPEVEAMLLENRQFEKLIGIDDDIIKD